MSYVDMVVGIVLLMAVAITAVTAIMVFNQLENHPDFNNSLPPQGYAAFNTVRQSLYVWDYAGVFLLFSIIGITVLSAATIRSRPAFFAVGLLFMLILTTISTLFTLIYTDLMSNTYFVAIANTFTWTLLAFQWLPIIGLVGMAAIAVATHGKTRI